MEGNGIGGFCGRLGDAVAVGKWGAYLAERVKGFEAEIHQERGGVYANVSGGRSGEDEVALAGFFLDQGGCAAEVDAHRAGVVIWKYEVDSREWEAVHGDEELMAVELLELWWERGIGGELHEWRSKRLIEWDVAVGLSG